MRQVIARKHSTKIFICVILVLTVLVALFVTVFIQSKDKLYKGGQYPAQLRINTGKTKYKKSEYVRVDVSLKNVGDFAITPQGACVGYFDVIVDWQFNLLRDKDSNRACTSIGLPRLQPDKELNVAQLELDLSRFDTGKHTLTAVYDYEDPVGIQQARSNEVAIEITPGDNISKEGCYLFTDYPVSYCEQIMIRTTQDLTKNDNNKICQRIYKKYIDRYAPRPQPIPDLSTVGCNEGKPAVFVFNVPIKDVRIFERAVELAKKSEKVCRLTTHSAKWALNPVFTNNQWDGC